MLIDCPTCARSYHVSPAQIEGGRTVICPRCDAHWHVGGPAFGQVFGGQNFGGNAPRLAFGEVPRLAAPDRVFGDLPPSREVKLPTARKRRRVAPAVTLGLAALALVSLTIGARAKIVQLVPRAAALYGAAGLPVNLRGLAFRNVHSDRLSPSAADIVVTGEIRNVAMRASACRASPSWSATATATRSRAGARRRRRTSSPPAERCLFPRRRMRCPPASRAVLVQFESDDAA